MNILFLLITLLSCNDYSVNKTVNELELHSSSVVYYDVAGKQEYRMVTYKITNLSADKYAYTWIFYEALFATTSWRIWPT